jgi:hypothetical protein
MSELTQKELKEELNESYAKRGSNALVNAMQRIKLSSLNERVFRIGKWSQASQLFFDIGFFGIFLFALFVLQILPYFVLWFYAIFVIFLTGFVFTKPNKRYNFIIVIILLVILAFLPSNYMTGILYSLDTVTGINQQFPQVSQLYGNATGLLSGTNISDITDIVNQFMNIINLVVFIAFVGYGLTVVGDIISFDYGEAVKRLAFISLAIVVMSLIYGILNIGGVGVNTMFDSMGEGWDTFVSSVGLAQLDAQGNSVVSITSSVNVIVLWFPVIMAMLYISMAVYFRKRDFKSILWSRSFLKEESITIERVKQSIPALILLMAVIIYIVGYNLSTAEPTVSINPIITLTFYISAGLIIFLISNKTLILNKSSNTGEAIKDGVIWTLAGLMILFLWFQVFQPTMYALRLIDYPTGLIMMSQEAQENLLTADLLEQLFLIALPETLIFQILFIGLGNRIWYWRKSEIIALQEEVRLTEKKEKLQSSIEILPELTENVNSSRNRRNIYKYIIFERQIRDIDTKLEKTKLSKVPYSYFVLPTLIFSLLGSFIFSWYHSFRRGITFIDWFQNPMLGLTYMGAGMILCLVGFFSWFGAIIVHWFNNMFAILFF